MPSFYFLRYFESGVLNYSMYFANLNFLDPICQNYVHFVFHCQCENFLMHCKHSHCLKLPMSKLLCISPLIM